MGSELNFSDLGGDISWHATVAADKAYKLPKYRADIIEEIRNRNGISFLIRLQSTKDLVNTYGVVTEECVANLFASLENRKFDWGKNALPTIYLPGEASLIQPRRWGLMRNIFIKKSSRSAQTDRIQSVLKVLMSQVISIRDDPAVQDFFMEFNTVDRLTPHLRDILMMKRSQGLLSKVQGNWMMEGSEAVMTVDSKGTVLYDKKVPPDSYHIREHGVDLDRTLARGDGWSVDLEMSCSRMVLFWVKPENPVIQWNRA